MNDSKIIEVLLGRLRRRKDYYSDYSYPDYSVVTDDSVVTEQVEGQVASDTHTGEQQSNVTKQQEQEPVKEKPVEYVKEETGADDIKTVGTKKGVTDGDTKSSDPSDPSDPSDSSDPLDDILVDERDVIKSHHIQIEAPSDEHIQIGYKKGDSVTFNNVGDFVAGKISNIHPNGNITVTDEDGTTHKFKPKDIYTNKGLRKMDGTEFAKPSNAKWEHYAHGWTTVGVKEAIESLTKLHGSREAAYKALINMYPDDIGEIKAVLDDHNTLYPDDKVDIGPIIINTDDPDNPYISMGGQQIMLNVHPSEGLGTSQAVGHPDLPGASDAAVKGNYIWNEATSQYEWKPDDKDKTAAPSPFKVGYKQPDLERPGNNWVWDGNIWHYEEKGGDGDNETDEPPDPATTEATPDQPGSK